MKILFIFFGLFVLFESLLAVQVINNTETYKPCFPGSNTCNLGDTCFQYFCYPKSGTESPLKSCKRKRDCKGQDVPSRCFKHLTFNGVCVPNKDIEICDSHEECKDRGGKCCGDYCCNTEYFHALQQKNCNENDEVCKYYQIMMTTYEILMQ